MWKIWDDWSRRYTLSSWHINQEIQRFKNIDNACTVKSAKQHVHRESTKEVWNGQTANLSLLHLGLVESFSSYLQGMSPLIFRPTNRQLDVWPTCQQQPDRISLQQLESYPSIHVYTHRSTSGYEFQFANGTISWSSRKQPTVSKFSTEAECVYVALSSATQEATSTYIWLCCLMKDLDLEDRWMPRPPSTCMKATKWRQPRSHWAGKECQIP